ncbi:MAG: hypothetical protein K0R13_1399 [Propionibacteriaceae bacterium]|nr:hypothetical protein [Propionibacteriaceae bacterium]
MALIKRHRIAVLIKRHRIAVFLVLAYALAWGATPWNSFFALGVPLAALIVVMTEGLSGFKGADRMPARPRHRAMAEWEELR